MLQDAESDPTSAFAHGVIGPLRQLPAPDGPPRYILLDGLDEALAADRRPAGVSIPELLMSERVQLPRTGCGWSSPRGAPRRRSQRFRPVRELKLDAHDARNLTDVRAYLERRLSDPDDMAPVLVRAGLSLDEAATRLSALADGSFVYAKHAADTLKLSNVDSTRSNANRPDWRASTASPSSGRSPRPAAGPRAPSCSPCSWPRDAG